MKRILATFILTLSLAFTACPTPTNPDSFYQIVVTCTEGNSNNPQAGAAVLNCLTGAVSGDYAACLQGLVTAGYWSVAEVACIVRGYAESSSTRINNGTGTGVDSVVWKNANAWLRKEQIRWAGAK